MLDTYEVMEKRVRIKENSKPNPETVADSKFSRFREVNGQAMNILRLVA